MADTVTVYHPNPDLAGVKREVPKDTVEAWVKQGWKKTEPKAARDAREAETE